MVQEQFGFGVNEVSLKGAGKLYEVLARNAGQKAAVAGKDAGTAFGQYSQGMSDFNNYFRASQSTEQAANATENRAMQALNQGRASASRAGQRVLQDNIRKAGDVVTSVNSLLKTGNAFASTLERSRLQEGMVEGMKTAGEYSLIQDPDEKKKAIEGFLAEYQENPQNPYNQGMARSIFPLYAGAVKEADVKRREVGIRSMLAMADNSYVNSGDKLEYNMPELQKFAKAQNLSMGEFRDALYSTIGGTVAQGIAASTDFNMLNTSLEKWAKIKETNFNNDFFLKTKNVATQQLIGKTDRNISTAIAQAKAKIKTQAETDWDKIISNPKIASAEQLEYTLNNMQLSPIEKGNKSRAFSKKYAEQAVDEQFRLEFSPTTSTPYWDHIPAATQKAAERKIGMEGSKAFLYSQPGRLEDILHAHPGHVQEIGVNIGKIFTNGTGQEKSLVYEKIMEVRETSSASQALSQTMNDGEFARILAVGGLAKAMGGATVEQVEASWEKASQMLSNTTGSAPLKMTPNDDLWNNMTKDSRKMGKNGGRFEQVVKKIFSINQDVAEDQYDTIEAYFSNLSDKVSVTVGDEDRTLSEDLANAPDHFTNKSTGVIPGYAEEAKGLMLEEVSINFFEKNGYKPNIMSMTYLPNGVVAFGDEFGNTITHATTDKYIKAFNQGKYIEEQIGAIATKELYKGAKELGQDILGEDLGEGVLRQAGADLMKGFKEDAIGRVMVDMANTTADLLTPSESLKDRGAEFVEFVKRITGNQGD